MSALDNLTASLNALNSKVQELTTSVDNAVAAMQSGTATDVQLNILTTTADAVTAAISAQAARLNAAVTPPAP